MEELKEMRGRREWKVWAEKNGQLATYKEEDYIWSRRAMFQWLIENNKNTRYFQALTA